jgi:hypothetical protein
MKPRLPTSRNLPEVGTILSFKFSSDAGQQPVLVGEEETELFSQRVVRWLISDLGSARNVKPSGNFIYIQHLGRQISRLIEPCNAIAAKLVGRVSPDPHWLQ